MYFVIDVVCVVSHAVSVAFGLAYRNRKRRVSSETGR